LRHCQDLKQPTPEIAKVKVTERSKGGKRGSNTPRAGSNGTVARESSVAAEAVERFRKRDSKGSEVALKTVRAALEHVLEKPTEEKYRCLKGSNARVKSEISAFPEAVQILRLAGFSLVGEDLVLPERAPLQTIRDVLVGLSQPPQTQPRSQVGRRSI
jgi:hypothetical protein